MNRVLLLDRVVVGNVAILGYRGWLRRGRRGRSRLLYAGLDGLRCANRRGALAGLLSRLLLPRLLLGLRLRLGLTGALGLRHSDPSSRSKEACHGYPQDRPRDVVHGINLRLPQLYTRFAAAMTRASASLSTRMVYRRKGFPIPHAGMAYGTERVSQHLGYLALRWRHQRRRE